MIKFARLARCGFVGAIFLNLVLGISYIALRQDAQVYLRGQQFPEIAGIDVRDKTRVAREAPCYVIRLTADGCPYCRRDRPAYSQVADLARQVACDVVAIAPRAGQMAAIPGEESGQLKYVTMDLGEVLNPFFTPQTIILDEDRRLAWRWSGTLDDRALADGLAALRGIGSRASD